MAFLSTKTGLPSFSDVDTSIINIVDNPSARRDTTGWTAGTNHSISRDISNSPLAGVIDSCFAISATTAMTEAALSGVYAGSQAMPVALRNGKVQGNMWVSVPPTSAGTWRFSVYNSLGVRMPLDRDSGGTFTLPGGYVGQLPFTFDAADSGTYWIGFTQTARTSANTLYVTNISIGNGQVSQTAAVGRYESVSSYAITGSISNPASGAGATYLRTTDRDGDWAVIRYEYRQTAAGSNGSGSYFLPLPAGLTIDYSRAGALGLTTAGGYIGGGTILANSIQFNATAHVYNQSPYTNKIYLVLSNETTAPTEWGSALAALGATTIVMSCNVRIPIAEWSSTVNLGAGAQVEYAYNSSATTSSDTTSFAYGLQGVAIQNFAPAGVAAIAKRVQFQYPKQAGDVIEFWINDTVQWMRFTERIGGAFSNDAGTTGYGVRVTPVNGSNTQFDVNFYSQPLIGTAWSAINTWKWVLVKYNPSAPVGFGLAGTDGSAGLYKAGQAPGLTTGAVIPAGYVGEVLRQSRVRSGFLVLTTGVAANVTASPLTLQPGVYLLSAGCSLVGTATSARLDFGISTTSATLASGDDIPQLRSYDATTVNLTLADMPRYVPPYYINISSTTTYYLVASAVFSGGTGNACGYIQAVRIA